jgi:hypothetical protein
MNSFTTAAVLALAIGAGAWTLAKSTITAPIRVWLAKKEGKAWDLAFDLFKCPYCLSHWMAFFAVAIWRPWLVSGILPLRFLATSFAMVAGASAVVLVIRKALT